MVRICLSGLLCLKMIVFFIIGNGISVIPYNFWGSGCLLHLNITLPKWISERNLFLFSFAFLTSLSALLTLGFCHGPYHHHCDSEVLRKPLSPGTLDYFTSHITGPMVSKGWRSNRRENREETCFSNRTVLLILNKNITHIIFICSSCAFTSMTKRNNIYTNLTDDLIKFDDSNITNITSKLLI